MTPTSPSHRSGRTLRVPFVALLLLAALQAGATRATGPGGGRPALSNTAATSVPAYWLVAADGGIFAFGGVPFKGSMGGRQLNAEMVGVAGSPDGLGYWEDAADGGIFAFGDAAFHGSMGNVRLNAPVVGMAVDGTTGGYWEVAADGGIFAFDAPFYGSMGTKALNKPIVAMASTPDARGYWLVASDGGTFSFGDARFWGSMGGRTLVAPIVSMAASNDGNGYWLVASDGGIFAFGDAPFNGSLGGDPLTYPVASMAGTGTGTGPTAGYWLTDANGAVTSFGNAGYDGSAPQHLNAPVVGMAKGRGNGSTGNTAYQSGAFGYDVSRFQDNPPACTQTLPSGHTIGVVQATGIANGAVNPCLAHEAAWAGAGLNFYIFMNYGTDASDQPGCNGNQACNWGYEAAVFAFDAVRSQGADALVPWWLDVEDATDYWSTDTAANDQVIAGALTFLRGQGINTVGIYTSPLTWSGIAGSYQPPVPLWIAWYTGNPASNCATARSYAAAHGNFLPTGPILLTQYTDTANGQSLDGDYAC